MHPTPRAGLNINTANPIGSASCPKLIDIKDIKPNVALTPTTPVPMPSSTLRMPSTADRPMSTKSLMSNPRNVPYATQATGMATATAAAAAVSNYSVLYNAMMGGSAAARAAAHHANNGGCADSTTPPPNNNHIQCTSSSGSSMSAVASTAELDKKAANSIRGIILMQNTKLLFSTCSRFA